MPFFVERVLDLEQVGEVARGLDADGEVDGLVVVIEDRQLLVEAVADRPLADHRELRVDVDGPVPGTRKNRVSKYWRSSVDSAFSRWPLTVRTHVERKRVSNENRPVGSVADASMSPRVIADDERVAVEDPDQGRRHRSAPPLADGSIAGRSRACRRGPGTGAGRGRAARVAVHRERRRATSRPAGSLAPGDIVEVRSIGPDDCVGRVIRRRDSEVTLRDRQEPVVDPVAVRRCQSARSP